MAIGFSISRSREKVTHADYTCSPFAASPASPTPASTAPATSAIAPCCRHLVIAGFQEDPVGIPRLVAHLQENLEPVAVRFPAHGRNGVD